MHTVGFEPTISAGELPQTYAFDGAATGTGKNMLTVYKYEGVINLTCKNVTVTNRTILCVNYRENVCGCSCSIHSEQIKELIRPECLHVCYCYTPKL